jgi:hypothetical protein
MSGSGSTLFGVYDRTPPPSMLPSPGGGRVLMTATASRVAEVVLTD